MQKIKKVTFFRKKISPLKIVFLPRGTVPRKVKGSGVIVRTNSDRLPLFEFYNFARLKNPV